ncbi:MAG: FKBP-type peptidyl-prolyl cis-trans isomerase N-terminal domain-containing protein [Pleomorphochaeta sp.]
MKIKKLSLIITLCVMTLFVSANAFAAGTNEVKSSETIAMIQNIEKANDIYTFDVLTEDQELSVLINKENINTIYNLDDYAIGDYVSFNNLNATDGIATTDNIRYITPLVTSGSIVFVPTQPVIEEPVADYGFDNDLEHGFEYTYGYSLLQSFNSQGLYVNANYFVRGILDIVSIDTEDLFTTAELQNFVTEYQAQYQNPDIEKKSDNGDVTSLDQINDLEKPEDLDNEFAYAYGYLIAAQFLTAGIPVDDFYFPQGVLDAAYGNESQLTQYQMDNAMRDFEQVFTERQNEALNQIKEKNLNDANAFLTANKDQNGVITLDSGVQYRVTTDGDSTETATADDEVTLDYELTLLDGTVIDSSYERGTPATFKLSQVIPGFSEAVMQMNPGDSIIAWIPADQGYGEDGNQNVEPNALLTFRIDLISINK